MAGNRFRGLAHRLAVLPALLFVALLAAAAGADTVDVELVSDDGRAYPAYRIVPPEASGIRRAFVEARKGERYGIRVANRTGDRVGVVISVDGRNIISGEKSRLRATERMYILPPYGFQIHEGWRTDRDTVNRFYFTDPADSYAAAFGDDSAVGVISVAVFRERRRFPPVRCDADPEAPAPSPRDREEHREERGGDLRSEGGRAAQAPSSAGKEFAPREREGKAGTGFGEESRSPSVRVAFQAERRPAERHVLKYEWRETLCRLGIADCRRSDGRFADDGGFAPYPPGRSARD